MASLGMTAATTSKDAAAISTVFAAVLISSLSTAKVTFPQPIDF